jgi:hypothetical protein
MNLQMGNTQRQGLARRTNEAALDATFEIQTYVAKTAMPAPPPAGGQ